LSEAEASDVLDRIGHNIGQALSENDLEFSAFGDSPVEEMTRPEADMIEDDLQISAFTGSGRRVVEAIPLEPRPPEDFRQVTQAGGTERNFKIDLCIDGSLRTKYMGEILVSATGGGAPFIASHIGALVVKIDYETGKVSPTSVQLKLGLYIPAKGIIPDIAYERIKTLESSVKDLYVEPLGFGETEGDLRLSAGGKVRNRMHELEIGIVDSLPTNRGWLLIDGALRIPSFYSLSRTIGVAKSFSHKVIFSANDGRRPRSISHLARLPLKHRSPIYRYRPAENRDQTPPTEGLSNLVFWYLRLRTPPPEMEPLGGIVKIDLPFHDESPDDLTHIADQLSEAVLDISNPSIFPRPRWPSFLYPIRVTEEYLGSMLYGANHFMRLGVVIRSAMQRT